MRNTFAAEMTKAAAADDRIVLLSGDIGNRLFNPYKAKFADRFYNCGVAEANMTTMAAGLAMCGMRPVTYTIASFNTVRCLEQIRIDLCYHNLPVVLVGTGAGLSYARLGSTHHSLEDIAQLRSLPGMTVICPGDPREVRLALHAALKHDGPCYLRLGKKGEPEVHTSDPHFEIGKAIVVREGTRVCLLSTGNTLPVAVEASEQLEQRGISTRVVSFHTVKPLDEAMLRDAFGHFDVVVTIEEHSLLGGFGSYVGEWLIDRLPQRARLLRVGTADTFPHLAGSQSYFREKWGINAQSINERVCAALDGVAQSNEVA